MGGRVTGAQRQVARLRLYLQAILDTELCSIHGKSSGHNHFRISLSCLWHMPKLGLTFCLDTLKLPGNGERNAVA